MKRFEYNSLVQRLKGEELAAINGGNNYTLFEYFGKTMRAIVGALENPPKLPSATVYK